jgi:hypothetical protein
LSLLVSITLFFIVGYVLYTRYRNNFQISFGAEYGAIAISILEGRGYSNPFYLETGPTAWMLPVLVYLITAVISVFGNGYAGFYVLTAIKILCYTGSVWMSLKILKIDHDAKWIVLFLMLFFLFFLFSPYENFGMIIDLWLIVFIQAGFFFTFVFYTRTGGRIYLTGLTLVMFLVPLIAPGFAFPSILIMLLYVLSNIKNGFRHLPGNRPFASYVKAIYIHGPKRRIFLPYVLPGFSFMLAVALWTGRNYRVLDTFVLSKSNMPFEFYLANVMDYNGQLSNSTLELYHPNRNPELIPEIKKKGEIKWIQQFKQQNRNYLETEKRDYLRKIFNRFMNAFFFIHHDQDNRPVDNDHAITARDYRLMDSLKLIHKGEWMCLTLNPKAFREIAVDYPFENSEAVFDSFNGARNSYLLQIYAPANFIRSLMMSMIPTGCMIFLCLIRSVRKTHEFQVLAISYLLYLFIYVLISHQLRYQKPLFLLQVMLIIMSLQEIKRRFHERILLS